MVIHDHSMRYCSSLIPLFIIAALLCKKSNAQSLQDVINESLSNNFSIKANAYDLEISKLNFRSFRLGYRPGLLLNAVLPYYEKDNFQVIQPDGSVKFVRRRQNTSNIGLSFSQPVSITGGSVSVNTELFMVDDLEARNKQFNGTPVFIRYQQPVFGYNKLKWDRVIEPLRLKEANLIYSVEMRSLVYETCRLYFDVINARTSEQLAITNLEHISTNLAIEKRRVELGLSTEDKLFALQMQELRTKQQLQEARVLTEQAATILRNSMNDKDTGRLELVLPENFPVVTWDIARLVAEAKQNLPQYVTFERASMENESALAQAKAQGREINLTASYGLNKAANKIKQIYNDPNDQQRFRVGVSVPISDWGKRKNKIAIAELEQQKYQTEKKDIEATLLTEVVNLYNQLPMLRQNIETARALDTLSQKRFAIANRLFQSGKATILELQAAQTEKDNARMGYVVAIRRFWESWYLLQMKTNTSI